MSKKEFLKKLDKKLQILNDNEREDIINEYTDIIDNKVKDGKAEEEAVLEFGSIDTLINEILEAYKINVKYNGDNKEESFIEEVDSVIKKGAKELSSFTKDAYEKFQNENKNVKIEQIFEIVIKILVVVLLLMIPFSILKGIGYFIAQIMFAGFLSGFINFIWDLLIGIVFFIVIIFVGYTIIRNTVDNKEVEVKKEVKKTKKETKAETKIEIKDTSKSNIGSILMGILKIFVVFWSLPFVFMVGVSYVALSILIFGLTKGLMLYGFLLIVIAMILFFQQLLEVIYTLLFKNKLPSLYPFIISFVLFLIGGFMSVDYLINIKYYTNYVPEGRYEIQSTLEEININDKDILFVESENYEYRLNINNDLSDGIILLEARYYNNYVKNPIFNKVYYDNDKDQVILSSDFELSSFIINDYVDNLKNNTIYNIKELTRMDVTINANENTIKRVTFIKR